MQFRKLDVAIDQAVRDEREHQTEADAGDDAQADDIAHELDRCPEDRDGSDEMRDTDDRGELVARPDWTEGTPDREREEDEKRTR